jgi:multisubunit Na+/H+ antiporter MnhF subunit
MQIKGFYIGFNAFVGALMRIIAVLSNCLSTCYTFDLILIYLLLQSWVIGMMVYNCCKSRVLDDGHTVIP